MPIIHCHTDGCESKSTPSLCGSTKSDQFRLSKVTSFQEKRGRGKEMCDEVVCRHLKPRNLWLDMVRYVEYTVAVLGFASCMAVFSTTSSC